MFEAILRYYFRLFIVTAAICLPSANADAGKRAFLVGVSEYEVLEHLTNAARDAASIATKLESVGFTTTVVLDKESKKVDLYKRWSAFLKMIDRGDEVVVFFSGHGIEIKGKNFLVPYDSPKASEIGTEGAAGNFLISLHDLMVQLDDLEVGVQVWIIDACRENPFKNDTKTIGGSSGLGNQAVQPGQFVMFSANYGQFAKDKLMSDPPPPAYIGSPFVRTFISLFESNKHVDVRQFAFSIRVAVSDLVKPHPQYPANMEMLFKPWCFGACEVSLNKVTVKNNSGVVEAPSSQSQVVASALEKDGRIPNAIFLGKREALEKCSYGVSDSYPFGCEVKKLFEHANYRARSPDNLQTLATLIPLTNVNIRNKLPEVGNDSTRLGCVVDILRIGQPIRITGTVELSYSGDVYYWGLVDGEPKSCSPKAKSELVYADDAKRVDAALNFCSGDTGHPKMLSSTKTIMPDGKPRGSRSAAVLMRAAKRSVANGECDTAIEWLVQCMSHNESEQQLLRAYPVEVCGRLKA